MDLYGGDAPHFHLNGMLGTPKQNEIVRILGTFSDSMAITFAHMIQKSPRYDLMKEMPEFSDWFKTQKTREAEFRHG